MMPDGEPVLISARVAGLNYVQARRENCENERSTAEKRLVEGQDIEGDDDIVKNRDESSSK